MNIFARGLVNKPCPEPSSTAYSSSLHAVKIVNPSSRMLEPPLNAENFPAPPD